MAFGPRSIGGGSMRRWAITAALVGVVSLAAAGTATAFTAAPGYNITNFATGFASNATGVGPVGLAFGPSGTLFVSDVRDGHVYEFGSGGGAAGPATRVTATRFPGDDPHGMAFGKGGELYLALTNQNAIAQIDPGDGHVIRMVTKAVPCPVGLAVDPVSGDLFATSPNCSTSLWRVANPTAAAPAATRYANGLSDLDGIAFSPDGNIWVAAMGGGQIVRIAGTASGTPGAATPVTTVPGADGLAVVAGAGGAAAAVFVNGTDGRITRVDLSNLSQSPVMSGGSRGDFMGAGADGALYATQSDRVLRITATTAGGGGGIPNVAPTNPGSKSPKRLRAADVIRLRSASACLMRRRLTIRLVRFAGVKYKSAVVRVNGRKVRTLRGRALRRPVVLKRLTGRRIKVKVAVTTSKGRKYSLTRRYRVCAGR
jgi:sugar lactone lactonase YvrE